MHGSAQTPPPRVSRGVLEWVSRAADSGGDPGHSLKIDGRVGVVVPSRRGARWRSRLRPLPGALGGLKTYLPDDDAKAGRRVAHAPDAAATPDGER